MMHLMVCPNCNCALFVIHVSEGGAIEITCSHCKTKGRNSLVDQFWELETPSMKGTVSG